MSSGTGTKSESESDLQNTKELALTTSSSSGMDRNRNINISSAAHCHQNPTLNLQPKYLGKNLARGRFSGSTLPVPGSGSDNEHPLYAFGSAALHQWISSTDQSSLSRSGRCTPSRSTGTCSSSEWAQHNTRQISSNDGNRFSSSHLTMTGMDKVDPDYRRLMDHHAACNDPETENWE